MGRIEYEYPLFKAYYSNNSNNLNIRGNPASRRFVSSSIRHTREEWDEDGNMRYEIEIPTLNEKILEVVAGQNFFHRSEFVRYGDNFLLHIKLLLLNNGNFRCYSLQKLPQLQQIAWKGIST